MAEVEAIRVSIEVDTGALKAALGGIERSTRNLSCSILLGLSRSSL